MGISNIEIGAGKITFLGVDLGWTAGGMKLTQEEKFSPVKVDQYAAQVLDEILTAHEVRLTVPLAEGSVIALMESIFAGREVDIPGIMFALQSGVGIDRFLYGGKLKLELYADETALEGGNEPNSYVWLRALPQGKVGVSYSGGEMKPIVYEIEFLMVPDSKEAGTGTGALNSLTDSTKAWKTNQWAGFVLVDSAASTFLIQSNTATVATVIGTPATGAYTIRTNSLTDWGIGVGALNLYTDTDKAWTVNQWIGYTLFDDIGTARVISANAATTLTVSGTPITGDYTIGVATGTGKPQIGYRGKE